MRTLQTQQSIFDLPMGIRAAVCVTTNGIVKRNGHAVMGAGIAKEADQRFSCSKTLGCLLLKYGNHVYDLGEAHGDCGTFRLISFPTKNHWKDDSSIDLIRQSAVELTDLCNRIDIQSCYLTPPGCGYGHLDWDTQVKPVLNELLDDRFIIVFRRYI